jgi:uncharacterized protein (TIRG00374 family)
MHRAKKLTFNLLKVGLAVVLIYWLIHSKKITMEPFLLMGQKLWLIPLTLFSCLLLIGINNYRWELLLQGQGVEAGFWETFKLTFIGLFFNLAVPGSVGGDVLKAYFITRAHPHAKLKVVTSVLIDRIVGLYSVIIIAFLAIISQWDKIKNVPPLRGIAFFVFFLVGAFSVFFVVGFSRRIRGHSLTGDIIKKAPAAQLIEKIYNGIHAFRGGQRQFVIGIFLSLIAQSQMIVVLYIIARELGFNPDFKSFFFVFPVGFMAVAIPVSPGGVGVGQVVFLQLFQWFTGNSGTVGPTMITINQVSMALWSLVGAVFYFMNKSASTAGKAKDAGT